MFPIAPLLDDRCKLANALSLLSKNILSASSLDDNLCTDRCHSNFDAGITILSKLTRQKLSKIEKYR